CLSSRNTRCKHRGILSIKVNLIVHLNISNFKLDRASLKAQTVEEASNYKQYYLSLTWQERIRIATYLNSLAFGFDFNNPPRMDKTICRPGIFR
ncbi:MAG: hypothetical protein NWS46_01130, partial [Cyclobacteriaceae bacterium]|nr:hypothetical protein [Cyclobacteriaceae bacterium]